MILAYHRVSSNKALDAIMEAGRIVPAIYRLDPDLVRALCRWALEYNPASPATQGLRELVDEAVAYFLAVQEDIPGPKTLQTALKCEDILSGDAGRIFLSPGKWSEAGRGLGWPLSGFAFDAEELVSKGAHYRPRDLLPSYWTVIQATIDDPEIASPNEAKEQILDGLRMVHAKGELAGENALDALAVFRLQPGDENLYPDHRRRSNWPMDTEIVWDGPLSLEMAVEARRDDELIWSAVA